MAASEMTTTIDGVEYEFYQVKGKWVCDQFGGSGWETIGKAIEWIREFHRNHDVASDN